MIESYRQHNNELSQAVDQDLGIEPFSEPTWTPLLGVKGIELSYGLGVWNLDPEPEFPTRIPNPGSGPKDQPQDTQPPKK